VQTRVTCLVTIHGIGFQQPPVDDLPGYADGLHQNLSKYLDASLLSDDPNRRRGQRGDNGPIYVQSSWPPGSNNTEAGLARLGTWSAPPSRAIDLSDAPLVAGSERISHIALVYSHLEEQTSKLGASLEAAAVATLSLGHYSTISGLIEMLALDAAALLQHRPNAAEFPVGLRVRTDSGFKVPAGARTAPGPSGPLAMLRQLENDVAVYVCRNDLRERVRGFVRDALCRLAYRDDVEAIVVNAHSNGTLIAYDVLHELPPLAVRKVRALITAGSPLRKYTDLFWWGDQIGCIDQIGQWVNFWDKRDPVADPLTPGSDWHPGLSVPDAVQSGLYQTVDTTTGAMSPAALTDVPVNNVVNSRGGGLRAHNYWDNDLDFVQPVAKLLKQLLC